MHLPRYHSHKAIVVALALTLAACGKSPEEHYQQAQGLEQKADYKAAVIELKTVLQKQPNNREARLLLGRVLVKNGAYAEAEKELSKARSLGVPDDQIIPELARVYVSLGEPQKALDLGVPATGLSAQALAKLQTTRAGAQMTLGKRADAEKSIVAAIQADPKQPELLLIRAKLALMDKQKDQAGKLIDESLQQDPKFVEALYLKADLIKSENKPDEAIKVCQQILTIDPSQFRAHLAISNLLSSKGDIDAAEKALQAAEKSAGNSPMVRYARGVFELRRGKLDQASSALLDVLRVIPDHLATALAYAMASYGLGNYEQSIKYTNKVLAAEPNNLIATKILAGNLLKTGDVTGALKIIDPLMAKHPDDARVLALAGEAHLQTKDYIKAMAYLDKAAELEPENITIKTRRAAGHLATGENDEAMADLEQAASLSVKPGQADMALVMLRLKGKQYDKALQAIANLEKKMPDNPVTHNLRAAALMGKQDRVGARKALEQAIAIQPTFFPAVTNLARLDIQEKKYDSARKRYEEVLVKDKTNLDAMMALAEMADATKNDKEMIMWLEKAAQSNPGAMPPRLMLVRYHLAKKDPRKALSLANEMVSANPGRLEAMEMLGAAQLASGDQANAISTLVKATQMAPQSPDVFFRLGQVQLTTQHQADARKSFEKVLSFNVEHRQALDTLIQMDLSDKKPDAALSRVRQFQAKFPNSPVGYDREGAILMSQRQYAQSVKAYEQAIARGADSGSAISLHRALVAAGGNQAAELKLSAWLKAHPKDIAVRAYAAEFRMMAGQNAAAIVLYEDLLRQAPESPVMLNNLAVLYQRVKDKRALATAEQAYKKTPGHPATQDTLGWILLEQGQAARAVELLRKAIEKVPKADSVRYHYAVALARTGKQQQAKNELDALLKSNRAFPEIEEAKAFFAKM
ncbi:MAG: hypothetical protein B7Y41_03330 [Hydrogenophilales bacterium 28-61-23]|nr:MAG: hypothetical protein B7Y41_03330 [Hydrogenophilales bacterium 28-61-23]